MDVLERHGVNHIEMRGIDGKNISDLSTVEATEVKKRMEGRNFKVSALGSPIGKIGINDNFAPHLDKFKRTLELASILGTRYIRMFSFFMPEGKDPAVYRDEVLNRWSGFVEAAKGTNIILLHENEKEIYGDTAERCLDLLEALNCSYVKLTFDPANFVQCGEETYPKAYTLLRKHIEYMHIKDALFSDGSVTPAGYGDGMVKEIIQDLYSSGYSGFLSIEPHLAEFAGLAALERCPSLKRSSASGAERFAIAFDALKDILEETAG
jgi:sugar phosphate isomerase/epimerase